MSTTIYTFNGKIGRVGNSVLGKLPEPPAPLFPEVTIGTQVWSSTSIDIDDGEGGISTDSSGIKLYTPAAAKRIADSISGWHIPSSSECETLLRYTGVWSNSLGGKILCSSTGWDLSYVTPQPIGTDNYGFGFKETSGIVSEIQSWGIPSFWIKLSGTNYTVCRRSIDFNWDGGSGPYPMTSDQIFFNTSDVVAQSSSSVAQLRLIKD